MNEKQFVFWIEALKYDKLETVQKIFEQCSPKGRELLINGVFMYGEDCNQ